ncbi:hypothetical protein JYK22_02055, partial [Nonomuraea sp. RK-328]|nr:hypothetical protein [Nonomuraea sp. RK-328]
VFPLSAPQQIIWLQHQLFPESRAYYSTVVIDFHGTLDPVVLRQCVIDAVGRHDAMRLRICDVRSPIAYQKVAENVHVDVPEHDLRRAEDSERRRAALLNQQMQTEFDLQAAPLARWMLVRLADDHWQLFMTEHHLVHDGRSTVAFLSDVFEQYSAEMSGGGFVAAGAPSYEDYVTHTNSSEYRAIAAADVEWWAEKLKDATFSVDFPGLGSPRTALFDYSGGQHRQSLSADLMTAVRAAAQKGGHTVYAALLAVYAELCRRHSGQDDLVIGISVANRPPGFERTVGMMVNTIPLRMSVDSGAPCSEVATDAMTAIFDAIDHGSAPVQDLVNALGRNGGGLGNPLFNTIFTMHDKPLPAVDVPGLSVDMQVGLSTQTARFDLCVLVTPGDALHGDDGDYGYELVWDYSTQRFGAEDVVLLATGFEALLREYAAHPFHPIGALGMAAPAPSARSGYDERELSGDLPKDTDAGAVIDGAEVIGLRELEKLEPSGSLWLQAFRDILERDDIDDDTDFFQAGGYSLLVPQLLSHYELLSGWRPPASLVFEFSSPRQLEAASLARRG